MGFRYLTSLTVLIRLIRRVPLVGQERITLPLVHLSPYPDLVGFVSFLFFLYFKRFVTNLFMFCPIFLFASVLYIYRTRILYYPLLYSLFSWQIFIHHWGVWGRGKCVMHLTEQWINKSEVTNLTQVSNLYQCIISRSIIGRKQEAQKYMHSLQCVNSCTLFGRFKKCVNLYLREYASTVHELDTYLGYYLNAVE